MEHEGDVAAALAVAARTPRAPVDRDLLDELLERLSQQVREDEATGLARQPKRLGVAGGRDPHRQLGLHRPRQGRNEHVLAQRSRKADASPRARGAGPSRRPTIMPCFAFANASGPQDEVVGCQPDANETPTRPPDRLSTSGPLLGHANRVMKRKHDAAGADRDALVTAAIAAPVTEGLG